MAHEHTGMTDSTALAVAATRGLAMGYADDPSQAVPDASVQDWRSLWRGNPDDRTSVVPFGHPGREGGKVGLLLVGGPDPGLLGSYFPIGATQVVIGRTAEADVCVNDSGISRQHVRITRDLSGKVVAMDLGSTNGTWLNGEAIQSAVLTEGDRLQIGTSTEFLFGSCRSAPHAEVRLRQAMATQGSGTWVWVPATGALQLFGGIAGTLVRRSDDTEPRAEDAWAHVHPEDREALRAGLQNALRQGGTFQAEVRLLLRNGRASHVTLTGEAFRDRDGRSLRLAGTLMDVTERRRADVELQHHALLFDSLVDAVVVVGADGTIVDWNASAARVLGWSKVEALGRRPGALLLRGEGGRLDDALEACRRDGGRRTDGLTLLAKDGAEVPVEMVAFPLLTREQDRIASVAVFRDLGERQRLLAQVQASERLATIGSLAARLAHEIKNPLAAVASGADYVSQALGGVAGVLGPERAEVVSALADCREGAERIGNLLRDLQVFTREEDGTSPALIQPNDVLEFTLRTVVTALQDGVALVTDLNPVPLVQGRDDRFSRVFRSLIVNAAEAFEPGRTEGRVVRVGSRFDPATQEVVIEVADSGAGIPPEVLPHIFDPFFTTKAVGEGRGLGLFVCQGLVKELGGKIVVESELGKGTTFRVHIPGACSAPSR